MRIAALFTALPTRKAKYNLGRVKALHRSRRHLAELTKEQLKDVGLGAKEAQKEADRPFWDAPESWKR
ncbi:MAG: DUF1127 domain-containing protein [Sulfitobacter sp.]